MEGSPTRRQPSTARYQPATGRAAPASAGAVPALLLLCSYRQPSTWRDRVGVLSTAPAGRRRARPRPGAGRSRWPPPCARSPPPAGLPAPGEPRPGGVAGVGVEVVGDAAHHRVDPEGAVAEPGRGHLGEAGQHVLAFGGRRVGAVAAPHHHGGAADQALGDPAAVVLVEPGRHLLGRAQGTARRTLLLSQRAWPRRPAWSGRPRRPRAGRPARRRSGAARPPR